MILSKRERYVVFLTLAAVTVLALDRYALTPFLDRREHLAAQRQQFLGKLRHSRNTLEQRRQLAPQWEQMLEAGLASPPAAAESTALKAARDWAQESGLALSVLKPERARRRGELQETTIQAVGTGSMSVISRFLWRVESASLPVKVSDLQLGSRRDGSDDLTVQLRLSVLCLAPPKAPAAPKAANSQGEKL